MIESGRWVRRLIQAVLMFWLTRLALLLQPESWIMAVACYLASLVSFYQLLQAAQRPKVRLGVVFLFSAAVFLIYIPDTFVAFFSEIGFFAAAGLTTFSWVVVASLCFVVRVPVAVLPNRRLQALGVGVLPFVELVLLAVQPLAHFGAFSLPLAVSGAESPARSLSEVGLRETPAEEKPLLRFLVNPNWDDAARSQAASDAELGEFEGSLWEFLPVQLKRTFEDHPFLVSFSKLAFYWPETSLSLTPYGMRNLYAFLEGRVNELSSPEGVQREVAIVAGVGDALSNRVIWGGPHPVSGRLEFFQVKQKQQLVPFFESAVGGIEVWGSGSSAHADGDPWNGLRPLAESLQKKWLNAAEVEICYEALALPRRAPSTLTEKVVFTNHHLFSAFRVASLTYTHQLRVLAQLANQPLVLVSNGGVGGRFGAQGGEVFPRDPFTFELKRR